MTHLSNTSVILCTYIYYQLKIIYCYNSNQPYLYNNSFDDTKYLMKYNLQTRFFYTSRHMVLPVKALMVTALLTCHSKMFIEKGRQIQFLNVKFSFLCSLLFVLND